METQSTFEGWAIVEVFGHQTFAGYVTTQYFGAAAMFRIDVPKLEARERATTAPSYIGNDYMPAGTIVKEGAVEGYSKLFGLGAIYGVTPSTKEAVLATVERLQRRPLMEARPPVASPLSIAARGESAGDDDEYFKCENCGKEFPIDSRRTTADDVALCQPCYDDCPRYEDVDSSGGQ